MVVQAKIVDTTLRLVMNLLVGWLDFGADGFFIHFEVLTANSSILFTKLDAQLLSKGCNLDWPDTRS
jgi:hypothetical protein